MVLRFRHSLKKSVMQCSESSTRVALSFELVYACQQTATPLAHGTGTLSPMHSLEGPTTDLPVFRIQNLHTPKDLPRFTECTRYGNEVAMALVLARGVESVKTEDRPAHEASSQAENFPCVPP